MSKRNEHTFQFKASQIAAAAKTAAEYHEQREQEYRGYQENAAARVLETASVKLVRTQVTGGERIDVVVDYGDLAAYRSLSESFEKAETHRVAAERYRTDEEVYGSQTAGGDRMYELDMDDVHHFGLGDTA